MFGYLNKQPCTLNKINVVEVEVVCRAVKCGMQNNGICKIATGLSSFGIRTL